MDSPQLQVRNIFYDEFIRFTADLIADYKQDLKYFNAMYIKHMCDDAPEMARAFLGLKQSIKDAIEKETAEYERLLQCKVGQGLGDRNAANVGISWG